MLLRRSDFREIFRLLGSVRQALNDTDVAQRVQLQWLCRRLQCPAGVIARLSPSSNGAGFTISQVAQMGSFDSQVTNPAAWEAEPLIGAIARLPGRAHARMDFQLLPHNEWRQQSDHQSLWAGTGATRFLIAKHRLPDESGSDVIILGRTDAEKLFQARDLSVLKLLNAELHKLYADAAKPLVPAELPVEVTRRQREVLAVLLEGYGVKETARRLNISPRTVEDHIKALYQLFGVHSRSALMARFIR